MSIDVAVTHLKDLIQFIKKFREEGINEVLTHKESKLKAIELSIEQVYIFKFELERRPCLVNKQIMIHQHYLKKKNV